MINYNYYDITNIPMGELLDWLSDFKESNIRYSIIDNRYCNLSAYYDNNSVIDNSYSSYLVTVEGSLFDEKVFTMLRSISSNQFPLLQGEPNNIAPIFRLGVGERYDGNYIIQSVQHCFDDRLKILNSHVLKDENLSKLIKITESTNGWDNTTSYRLNMLVCDEMVRVSTQSLLTKEQYLSLVGTVKEVNKLLSNYRLDTAKAHAKKFYKESVFREMVIK